MSDGPHRSLNMRRHWKRLAERAASPAYSQSEVVEAFADALREDFVAEAPLGAVERVIRGPEQRTLLPANRLEELEAIRDEFPGSVPAGMLLDSAREAVVNGLEGEAVARGVVESALRAHGRGSCRQAEEHYHRSGDHGPQIRERLRAVREACGYREIASELLGRLSAPDTRAPKRAGIDDGPAL